MRAGSPPFPHAPRVLHKASLHAPTIQLLFSECTKTLYERELCLCFNTQIKSHLWNTCIHLQVFRFGQSVSSFLGSKDKHMLQFLSVFPHTRQVLAFYLLLHFLPCTLVCKAGTSASHHSQRSPMSNFYFTYSNNKRRRTKNGTSTARTRGKSGTSQLVLHLPTLHESPSHSP